MAAYAALVAVPSIDAAIGLLRQALGLSQLPPTQVVTALALLKATPLR